MITRFKIYESLNIPEVGDYVLCTDLNVLSKFNTHFEKAKPFKIFISSNIGKIIYIINDNNIYVEYDNPPHDILDYAFYVKDDLIRTGVNVTEKNIINSKYTNIAKFKLEEIIAFSNDKEEIEALISGNKYNL